MDNNEESDTLFELGRLLCKHRWARGLTSDMLADRLAVEPGYLESVENGLVDLEITIIYRICIELGIEVSYALESVELSLCSPQLLSQLPQISIMKAQPNLLCISKHNTEARLD